MKAVLSGARRFLPLAVSLVMAGAAVMVMRGVIEQEHRAVAQERQRLQTKYRTVDVLVAAKDVPGGAVIEPKDLTIAQVPETALQPYLARGPQDLVGMVTMAPIAEGEQFLTNKVRSPLQVPETATLSSLTPKGKRAVTIGVDAVTGVGGFVRPGDAVDILWTITVPGQQPAGGAPSSQGDLVTLTLFQEVPVLAVGREILGRSTQTSEPSNQYTVTLALTPQETSFLLFAREQGRIQLSLRSQQEEGQVAVVPANINSLMHAMLGEAEEPPPAKPQRQVEIYKGLERDVVLLPQEQ